MTHRATQILDAVVTTVTGLTTTGSNVFRDHRYPLDDTQLPALSVSVGRDSPLGDFGATNTAFIDSILTVYVDLVVKSTATNLSALILELRKEVHVALMADTTQGLSFVHTTMPNGMLDPEIDAEGEKRVMVARTEWGFHYRTSITDPSA